jgi:hypothetical protein
MNSFYEEQRFIKSWWFIVLPIILFTVGIPIGVYYRTEQEALGVIFAPLLGVFMVLIFGLLNLKTRINKNDIAVKFSFFHRKYKVYSWESISSVRIIKYAPLFEYGGWGLKAGWNGKKRAYSVSGDIGLEAILKDGSSVMIGTQQADKMKSYLLYLKEKYELPALALLSTTT